MGYIINTFRRNVCPFCNSNQIFKVGDLSYPENYVIKPHILSFSHIPELYRCKECFSGFSQNIIPPDVLFTIYQTANGSQLWTGKQFDTYKTVEVVNVFSNLLKEGDNVLDIGCNTGIFLDYAKIRKCITYGIEICEESVTILNQKGHCVYNNINQLTKKMDIIVAFDLIEHLFEPSNFFQKVIDLLKPNGSLYILTGNLDSFSYRLIKNKWWYINLPEHISFPSLFFFKTLKYFKINKVLKTYASEYHRNYMKEVSFRDYLYLFRKRQYNGSPSFFSDHYLVELKKK